MGSVPAAARSNASSRWRLPAVWVGLVVVALIVRLPFVLHVGPNEGGGDEWYTAWRSWSVLFERGNPGNFLHPALFYDAGAALFSGLYLAGRMSGAFHSPVDLLADFVLHEAKYLQALQLLAAVFGALTVPVVFELARRIGGWRAGLVAAGILAILPLHVEYSHRARVDSLCVLLTALGALALHRLAERGRRRDFLSSGVMVGLATAANYPAALLAVAYLAAALFARHRSTSAEFVRSFALGVVAAAAAFALTNPYVVLTPAAAFDGFTFQLSFAVKAASIPREGVPLVLLPPRARSERAVRDPGGVLRRVARDPRARIPSHPGTVPVGIRRRLHRGQDAGGSIHLDRDAMALCCDRRPPR